MSKPWWTEDDLRALIRDEMVRAGAIDNPDAGGPGFCSVCQRATQWATCPVCQPKMFAKLP